MVNDIQINKGLLTSIVVFMVLVGILTAYSLSTVKNTSPSNDSSPTPSNSSVQEIYLKANADGTYDKSQIVVKKGVPVKLHFTADRNAGCGRQLTIFGLNLQAISQNGQEQIVEFTPQKEGTYRYSCSMNMWGPGKLIVQ